MHHVLRYTPMQKNGKWTMVTAKKVLRSLPFFRGTKKSPRPLPKAAKTAVTKSIAQTERFYGLFNQPDTRKEEERRH